MTAERKQKTRNLYFPTRLLETMKKINDYPLTLIEAPMGYGKTTAVREVLRISGENSLWQSIYDPSVNGFWGDFCRLFSEVDLECSASLMQLGFPNDSVSRQEALKILEKLELSVATVVVIDDYHVIERPELNAFIEFIVRNEISNLHIVLTMRYTTFHSIEELKLKGYLHHITKESFEFNTKEIKAYYRICGIGLKDAEVEKLLSLTEGWISALYLLMLNYLDEGSFSNGDDIYKLVEKTLYMPFSEEIKGFLQTICFFDSFTVEQAVHMSQKDDAGRMLSQITQKNTLIKYDIRSKTYQIHNMFTKLLIEMFNRQTELYKSEIYGRVARWYEKNDENFSAMHYFHLAKDFDSLMRVVEKDKGKSIYNENCAIFMGYFEECPPAIKVQHPIALLVYAINLFLLNKYHCFGAACKEFVTGIQNNSSLDEKRRNLLLGEFELLLSFTGYNDIMKMLEHIQKAAALLKQPAVFIETKEGWTFGSPSVLYMFYREKGTLERDVANIKIALPDYSRITNGHGKGGDSVMEAEWYFNRGDLENAEIVAHKALYTATQHKQYDIMISAIFLQARIALYQGTLTDPHQVFKELHDEITDKKQYNFIHTIELCDSFICAGLKINIKNPDWIEKGDFESSRLFYPAKAFMNIVYSRILLAKGDYLKLLGSAERFIALASVFPNLLAQVYTYIHVAVANERIYRHDAALTALNSALEIASADDVCMPFVENGEYIRSLLKEVHRQGLYGAFIGHILALYDAYKETNEKNSEIYAGIVKPSLTGRENEIAILAAEGLSNKEIAEKLFITQNTVKTQLKRVFEKLEITSRVMLKIYFE